MVANDCMDKEYAERIISDFKHKDLPGGMVFNFYFGDYTSVAPNATQLTNYYGLDETNQPLNRVREADVVLQLTDEERRLYTYLHSVDHVRILVSTLNSVTHLNELARIVIDLLKRNLVNADDIKKGEFLSLLIPFCKNIIKTETLNPRNIREHIKRLLSAKSVEEQVQQLQVDSENADS